MPKYFNKKCIVDGISFSSIWESTVYRLLKMRKNCAIQDYQPKVYMTDARILYKPDFKCFDSKEGISFYVEAKGFETAVWKIKKRLWREYGPARLEIYTKMNIEIIPMGKQI